MANLRLKPSWIIFPKVFIEANPDHDPELPTKDFQIEIGSDFVQNEDHSLHATIFVSNDDFVENNALYSLDIHVYSSFQCSKSILKLQKKIATEICLDIAHLLLGSVREIVATITSRGPWGPYVLPFVSAEDLAESLMEDLVNHKKEDSDSDSDSDSLTQKAST